MGIRTKIINWDFLADQLFSQKIIGWIVIFSSFSLLIWGAFGLLQNDHYLNVICFAAGALVFFACAKAKISKQDKSCFAWVFEDYPIEEI